jgi:hypothetical protein
MLRQHRWEARQVAPRPPPPPRTPLTTDEQIEAEDEDLQL